MNRYIGKRGAAVFLVLGAALLATGFAYGEPEVADPAPEVVEPSAPAPKAPRIPWIKDKSWTEIVEMARSNNQPVLIDFTADWCGPCRLLDVMVFTEKSVIRELSEVVTFQVDIDKPEYADFKNSLEIELIPTLVWCDTSGREVDRFTGYRSSDEFLDIVRSWRDNLTIDTVLARRGAASPEDPEVLLDLARRQVERHQYEEADVLYRRLMNLRHKADTRTVARGMVGLAELEEISGRPEKSGRLVEQAVALYAVVDPSPDVLAYRTEGLMEIALFQESRGDTSGVLETYRTMVQLDDRDVLGLDGFARTAVAAGVELEEATRCALRAMIFSDKDARIIGTLAETYYHRRMYDKAIRWINLAIERDPGDIGFQDSLVAFKEAKSAASVRYRGSSR